MELDFYTYSIPFKEPFITAGQSFEHRTGIISVLKKDGIQAMGEAAPLPGFSGETVHDVTQQIHSEKESLIQFFNTAFSLKTLDGFFSENQFSSSLRFCLYSIATFYLAQQQKLSLPQIIFGDDPKRTAVPINAVVPLGEHALRKVENYINEGFKTIKFKAGTDIQKLGNQLKDIRARFPDVRLRIDANQSWTFDQAVAFFTENEALGLEYCEEPLKTPSKAAITQLKNKSTVPLALDESLSDIFTLQEAASLANVLIIKPMVHGPVIEKLREIRKEYDIKIVLTSSLETGIGRLMTAAIASGIGSQDAAHGLATGSLLAEDLWRDNQFINNGMFTLPNADELSELMEAGITGIETQKLVL